jgi:hypothetical protein
MPAPSAPEVIKIEPRQSNASRRIGPFWRIGRVRSARCFPWYYNRNKKSVLDPAGAFGSRAGSLVCLGAINHTKDERWFISHGIGGRNLKNLVLLLSNYGVQADFCSRHGRMPI